jgi:multidrug resistance efflux pump
LSLVRNIRADAALATYKADVAKAEARLVKAEEQFRVAMRLAMEKYLASTEAK